MQESDSPKSPQNKDLTKSDAPACTDACTSKGENGPNRADRLAVIADLLTDLSADQRAEVIADLDPAERVAIARLLIGKEDSSQEG